MADRSSIQNSTSLAAWLAGALLLCPAGCRLTGMPDLRRPSYDAQKQALLEVVPLGTPREEAVDRIEAAGITGEFGVSESVYYCDFWRRPGEHWYLDIALYFDESGRLYKIGSGQAQTGVVPGADRRRDEKARSASSRELPSTESPTDDGGERSSTSGRAARRTPFADRDDLR